MLVSSSDRIQIPTFRLPRSSLSSKKHGSGVYIPLGRDLILIYDRRCGLKPEMGAKTHCPKFDTLANTHSWLVFKKTNQHGPNIQRPMGE